MKKNPIPDLTEIRRPKSTESGEEKKWFMIVDNRQIGPFGFRELKNRPDFNPDTLVWKKGFKEWVKARFVFELQDLFKDEPEREPSPDSEKKKALKPGFEQEEAVLTTIHPDPFQFLLWILLSLFIVFYIYFRVHF